MKSSRFLTAPWIMLATAMVLWLGACENEEPKSPVAMARLPKITPDYVGIVIPPNIAPLNFVIDEPGKRYLAKIYSASGEPIQVAGKTGNIAISLKKWRTLLTENTGKELNIDICVKSEAGVWNRYQTITNTIAPEAIDPFLAYRFMMPSSYFPKRMKICQRNLGNFEEQILLDTESYDDGCAHCHSFVGNDPGKMLIGIRSVSFPSATMYAHDGQIEKIGTKFGYTAWHPSGKIVAYSVNDVRQFYHTARAEIHDVVDLDSAIFYYDIEDGKTKKTPALADRKRLETYPAWTPDGKYMYFCSAPMLWKDVKTAPPRRYKEVKYDLMRISYDVDTDTWGPLETVLSADETGLSILLPRISPDGRFLLFCMGQYGCFAIYQPTSDLYMMDLQTGTYQKAPINSEYADAWHSWSSNSRWIVFSSKRQGGLLTRPFTSYVDANGQAHKPFVLPQENPSFYQSCYHLYSVPEFLAGPVTVNKKALVKAIINPVHTGVDTVSGASPGVPSNTAYKAGQSSVQ